MKTEYELIKEDYGERFAKFCRSSFPTLIEKGELYNIISSTFAPTRFLYDDLVDGDGINMFIRYINFLVSKEYKEISVDEIIKTPSELFLETGYTLYECNTAEDVLSFEKYYANGEKLCTFRDVEGRLDGFHIFFAVKNNVEEIKRENFKTPERQDDYGTSVICLQFLKGDTNYLSIKNRYNHAVENPDSTFSNNLELIRAGLTASFNKHYNFKIEVGKTDIFFDLKNYVMALDFKFYHYNYEIDNVYCCDNNVYIKRFEPYKLDKSRYELIDYFILDRKEKTLLPVISDFNDGVLSQFKDIVKIDVRYDENKRNKIIQVFSQYSDNPIIITIDARGRMIKFKNPNVYNVEPNMFVSMNYLKEIDLPEARIIGNFFMFDNRTLEKCNLPKAEIIECKFLFKNSELTELNIKNCKKIDDFCLVNNNSLRSLELPNVEYIGTKFLKFCETLESLSAPKVKIICKETLKENTNITSLTLPLVEKIDQFFMFRNQYLEKFIAPNLTELRYGTFGCNLWMETLYAPELKATPRGFLDMNVKMKNLFIPSVEFVGTGFLEGNDSLTSLNLPNVKKIGSQILVVNQNLKYFNAPNLIEELNYNFYDKGYYTSKNFKYFNCPLLCRKYPRKFKQKLDDKVFDVKAEMQY